MRHIQSMRNSTEQETVWSSFYLLKFHQMHCKFLEGEIFNINWFQHYIHEKKRIYCKYYLIKIPVFPSYPATIRIYSRNRLIRSPPSSHFKFRWVKIVMDICMCSFLNDIIIQIIIPAIKSGRNMVWVCKSPQCWVVWGIEYILLPTCRIAIYSYVVINQIFSSVKRILKVWPQDSCQDVTE